MNAKNSFLFGRINVVRLPKSKFFGLCFKAMFLFIFLAIIVATALGLFLQLRYGFFPDRSTMHFEAFTVVLVGGFCGMLTVPVFIVMGYVMCWLESKNP
jgi:hypothetical protein